MHWIVTSRHQRVAGLRMATLPCLILCLMVPSGPRPRTALGPGVAAAALTYYVAPAPMGDNAHDCLSSSTPCATIAAAIDKATSSADATVNIATGAYSETLSITRSVTLSGAGAGHTIIDGGRRRTVVVVGPGAAARISGLTVRGGRTAFSGGGVLNNGSLSLKDSAIVDNSATLSGGGIENTGALTVTASTVSGNDTTANTAFRRSNGGGINNTGTLQLDHSTISHNSATNPYSDGGGIATSGTMIMTGSSVISNTSAEVGGLENVGDMTVISSSISDNSGGGMLNTGNATLTTSAISGNYTSGPGGGIFNTQRGKLAMTGDTVSDNSATFGGGGIYIDGGVVTLTGSTVNANHGNGVRNGFSGRLLILNSTIDGNGGTSGGEGGGVDTYCPATTTILNSTISHNISFDGGGIAASLTGACSVSGLEVSRPVTIANTIVAGNFSGDSGIGGLVNSPDCLGPIASLGFNLIGSNAGCASSLTDGANGDQVGSAARPLDPHLGPLQDNGSSTWTRALLPGSPAIDGGNPDGCVDSRGAPLTTDQRGFPRPYPPGGRCDIGAYEDQGSQGSAAAPGGATTPELSSGELLATGLFPLGIAVLARRRQARRASARGGSKAATPADGV